VTTSALIRTSLAPLLLLGACPLAHATGASFIDGFYVADASVEAEDVEFKEGDGYGVKLRGMATPEVFVTAEYMNNEYDPFEVSIDGGVLGGVQSERFEIEVETFRIGLGAHLPQTPMYLRGEYVGYEAELSTTGSEGDEEIVGGQDREDGFGAHLGFIGRYGERFWLQAEAGYLDINDVGDGVELLGGAGVDFVPGFGLFADYRYSKLKEQGDELEFGDFRVGLRASFS
jgi:hypothetical protein